MGTRKTETDVEIAGVPRSEKANRGDIMADGSASAIWGIDRLCFSRFVTELSGVFLHRAVRDARLPAHDLPAVAGFERRDQLVPITMAEFRPTQDLALCARAFEAGTEIFPVPPVCNPDLSRFSQPEEKT
jgi:hypothetical protein